MTGTRLSDAIAVRFGRASSAPLYPALIVVYGGWCWAKVPVTPDGLTERFGRAAARAQMLAMCATVDEVGRVIVLFNAR